MNDADQALREFLVACNRGEAAAQDRDKFAFHTALNAMEKLNDVMALGKLPNASLVIKALTAEGFCQ